MQVHAEVFTRAIRPAYAVEMQPYIGWGQAQARRYLVAVHMQPLGGHIQVDAPVLGGDRQSGLRAQHGLILHTGLVVSLYPQLRDSGRISMRNGGVAQHVPEAMAPWRISDLPLIHD